MIRRNLFLLFCLCLLITRGDLAWSQEKPEPTRFMVEMQDDIRLATDVYLPGGELPSEAKQKYPVILIRSPYGKKIGSKLAVNFTESGYALAIQDVRGRFDSEGNDALVFYHEGRGEHRDGHETLEWITDQNWCDGNIVTWGGSALGVTQTMMAPGAPEALKAQYILVAFSDMYSQAAYQGGVWRKSMLDGWLPGHKFDPRSYKEFNAHPKYGPFWHATNAERGVKEVNAPAVFWGGWYDIFNQGTINSFVNIHNQGGAGARGKCRLLMGPWAHGTFDELTYPENAASPGPVADAVRFFNHHAKGEQNGVNEDQPVHYYVMGDPEDESAPGNFWRSAENWPPPADETPWYLHESGQLNIVAPTGDASLAYAYDPKNPVPTIGGQNLLIPKGPRDQREVEKRDDVLVFTSEKLTEPTEVSGRVKAKLYFSTDCPDTDFTVKLCDVYPDGRSMLVTDGIMRARYLHSFESPELLVPGQVYELEVDLWSTSLIFNKGHQIRVSVSSSNDPRFEPNPNTGADHFEPGDPSKVANNRIYLSKEYPSQILLPIYNETESVKPSGDEPN
ncbi:Cocaine esterase [Polystyrenella longa]|uniref:Cocaine esterase n=1 Tax=Polystyrenella longa TaxID=2528007 RepID=A0A518CJR1_9PLAN|nr:CocE/NonD family hydrolase [Polystyrenella longa]QDU79466.1 Cocaine esterase [Polystyrenella longa]